MNDAQTEQWRPMDTAPRDGTIVRLLVDYRGEDACHPLDDAAVTHTIGGNTDSHTGLNEGWKFAGWSWEQDCFCEGRGKPIGWLPLAPVPDGVEVPAVIDRAMLELAAKNGSAAAIDKLAAGVAMCPSASGGCAAICDQHQACAGKAGVPASAGWGDDEPRIAAARPPCTVCGTAYEKHGSYPTCATHPYTADGNCQHVGTITGSVYTGARCPGTECKSGCALARGVEGKAGDDGGKDGGQHETSENAGAAAGAGAVGGAGRSAGGDPQGMTAGVAFPDGGPKQ